VSSQITGRFRRSERPVDSRWFRPTLVTVRSGCGLRFVPPSPFPILAIVPALNRGVPRRDRRGETLAGLRTEAGFGDPIYRPGIREQQSGSFEHQHPFRTSGDAKLT
jgi:hypothetical protein